MLPGVFAAKKKCGTVYYRSGITHKSKHISLGSFSDQNLAHQAYLEASKILSDHNLLLADLSFDSYALAFEKRISLINFRDNGIYFKNPIYLRNKYFTYFLTPNCELKFDIDDLFYYSHHKIMARGGHLFVNDYGMQLTILSRYGIKSHAVPGRDYLFANGDETDFRYSNLIVVNPYHGVKQISQKNQIYYKTTLHLNGTLTIGVYPSAEIAAIAYNKAVDLAKKHGFSKNFMTNYITEYSPKEYATVYTKIVLAKRFLKYLKENTRGGSLN
ncbi:hypothetical protein FACS1894111_00950 [Clostridia bacterium]|nr:hypothetical protein FACS1894111_00950 [Clostridia bacterium]